MRLQIFVTFYHHIAWGVRLQELKYLKLEQKWVKSFMESLVYLSSTNISIITITEKLKNSAHS